MPRDDRSDFSQNLGQKRPRFAKVAVRSFLGRLNLSVVGIAAASAAALHSWPVLALGGAAYTALVAWDFASPEFWKKALGQPGAAPNGHGDAVHPEGVRDAGLRQTATRVVLARAELRRLTEAASGDVAVQLAGATVLVDELEQRASSLITVGDQLIAYLVRSDVNIVKQEIDGLRYRVEHTQDAQAKEQYVRTIQAREEQLGVLTDIAGTVERIYANLARIVATLEGLGTKVVRMGAMDAQAMDNLSGDMNAELDRMNLEISTFEETLKHLVAREASA